QLVAVVAEVLLEDAAQMRLGAARGRAVVVRQIEVVHAEVEGAADDRAQGQRVTVLPEVLPEAQRDRRQQHSGSADAAIRCAVVAGGCGDVGVVAHGPSLARPVTAPSGPMDGGRAGHRGCSGRSMMSIPSPETFNQSTFPAKGTERPVRVKPWRSYQACSSGRDCSTWITS